MFLLIGCLSASLLAGCNGDSMAEVSQPEESVVSEATKDTVQNEALRTGLQKMATLARDVQNQREAKNLRQILEILHDMD